MSKSIVCLNKLYIKVYCKPKQVVYQSGLYVETNCMSKCIVCLNKLYIKVYCMAKQVVYQSVLYA